MNCLFIGLGGAGSYAVATLHKMFHDYYAFEKANPDIKKDYLDMLDDEYLYIDTDESVKGANEFKNVIKDTEFINLGKASPDSIINLVEKKIKDSYSSKDDLRVKEWFDKLRARNSKTLENGADGVRMCSRIAVFNSCIQNGGIEDKIKEKIKLVITRQAKYRLANGGAKQPRVYIVTGSCGGTGSGIFLDVLYMIDEVFKASLTNDSTLTLDVRPIIVMPQKFIEELKDTDVLKTNYKLNSYAFFNEINAVLKDFYNSEDNTQFGQFYLKYSKTEKTFKPYRIAYLFDAYSTDKILTHKEATQKIANFLFDLELTAFNSNENDNNAFDTSTTNSLENIYKASRTNKYINGFSTLGYCSIEKGDYIFKKYIKKKLIYETLKYGFIGEAVILTDTEKASIVNEFDSILTNSFKKTFNEIDTIINDINSYLSGSSEKKQNMINLYKYDSINVSDDDSDEELKYIKKIQNIIKNFIEDIEKKTYNFCKQKLMTHSLNSTYALIDHLDFYYYNKKDNSHKKLFNIKLESIEKEKSLSGKQVLKFINEFKVLLQELIKQKLYVELSEGTTGFLDNCKISIKNFNDNISINIVTENWLSTFKKYLTELEKDESKSILPAISSLMNQNGDLIEGNKLDELYNQIVLRNPSNKQLPLLEYNDLENEDTVYKIKKKIVDEINGFSDNFHPKASINHQAKFDLFIEELVIYANKIIEKNPIINQYFKQPITDFLKISEIGSKEYEKICNKYKNYQAVEFTNYTISETGKSKYFVCLANFSGNEKLKADLNVGEDMKCKLLENPFYNNKIVKLIVELGYNINEYKFYNEQYKTFFVDYFNEKRENFDHQPFIHKDFLGDDLSGDVWKVLQKKKEESTSITRELISYSKEDVFKFFICYVMCFYNQLVKSKYISEDIKKGIIFIDSSKEIEFKYFSYSKALERFNQKGTGKFKVIGTYKENDITTYNKDLIGWIKILNDKKGKITNQYEIYKDTMKFMHDEGIFNDNIEKMLSSFVDYDTKKVKGNEDFISFYKKRFNLEA